MKDSNNNLSIIIFICLIVGGLMLVSLLQKPTSNSSNPLNNNNNKAIQANFAANQNPSFKINIKQNNQDIQNNAKVYDPKGNVVDVPIQVTDNGSTKQITLEKGSSFTPGKYTFIYDNNGQKIEQDFTWGVLAINPNKSIYVPGETADLALAVLDQKGNMVCNADVTLLIKGPSGQTTTLSNQNGTIIVNPECKEKKMTYKPDYETAFRVSSVGNYQMSLTAVTPNGTYNIQDFFNVANNVPFDIERFTATRIFPNDAYPVAIKISANQDFTGQISEAAPASFAIAPLENTVNYNGIEKNGKVQYIVWNLSMKKGETVNIGYNYKAPPISPQFYILGPLNLISGNTAVFAEQRSWQLAIDSSAYSTDILNTSGLLAYWRLGETSGISAADSSGNGHGGTYTGGYTLGQTGAITDDSNKAVSLNGSTGFVDVPYSATLDLGDGPFTLEAWIKLSSNQGQGTVAPAIISDGYYDTFEMAIESTDDSDAGTLLLRGNGGFYRAHGSTRIDDANWHYVAVTKNGTSMHIYVDGSEETTVQDTSALGTNTNEDNLAIGRSPFYTIDYFPGLIDEAAVYNTVLTLTQIQDHHNTGTANNPTPTPTTAAGSSDVLFNGVKMQGIQVH